MPPNASDPESGSVIAHAPTLVVGDQIPAASALAARGVPRPLDGRHRQPPGLTPIPVDDAHAHPAQLADPRRNPSRPRRPSPPNMPPDDGFSEDWPAIPHPGQTACLSEVPAPYPRCRTSRRGLRMMGVGLHLAAFQRVDVRADFLFDELAARHRARRYRHQTTRACVSGWPYRGPRAGRQARQRERGVHKGARPIEQ